MKIAIVGPGALGSFYGAKLCQAGHDVRFLLRSDYEAVRTEGVWIESSEGSFQVRPHAARTPQEIGPAELVLVCLKTTANHILPQLLPPLTNQGTTVLTLQNGLGNENVIASIVASEKTMGGVCFVCLNRIAPGRIRHIAHGNVVIGEYGRPPSERTQRICQTIAGSGVVCKIAPNLEQARWEKLVWNIPFNGLGVASAAGLEAVFAGRFLSGKIGHCLTTDLLLSNPAWERLVRDLMMETIAAARAQGLEIPKSAADAQIERTRNMGAYKASTLIDFERGQELELDGLFLEPLRRAKQAGVTCPRLAALCVLLKQMSGLAP